MDRQSSSYNTTINKETDLSILRINPNGASGVVVTLQKPILDTKTSELGERTFVNLYTRNNISFGKGFIISRQYYFKPIATTSKPSGDSLTLEEFKSGPIDIEEGLNTDQ